MDIPTSKAEKSESLMVSSVEDGNFLSQLEAEGKSRDDTPSSEEEDDGFVHGFKLIMITLALMMAVFLMGLDNTVLATASPKIATEFNSFNDVGWFGSAYLLSIVSLQPLIGQIYSILDIKKVFVSSVLIFECGSIICAVAQNAPVFIVGRAIAGTGAAGMFSGGMTIIGFTVPIRHRAIYFAILSSMGGVAGLIGPPLGGVFVDSRRLTWRFCFWINLPFGALSIMSIILFFKPPYRPSLNLTWKEKISKLDIPGAILFISAIVCLLLALQWGGSKHPWRDSQVWGCLLGFGLLLGIFVIWQIRKGESALIRPSILSRRSVAANCLFTCMISMGLNIHTYYLPFYFQSVKGVSAESSGLRIVPYSVSFAIISLGVGYAVASLGTYGPFMVFGSAVFTVGSGLIFTLQQNSNAGKWIGYQLVMGLGCGTTLQLAAVSIQAVLSTEDLPMANALIIFANYLGGSLALSIAENIFLNTLLQRLAIVLPQPQYAPSDIVSAGPTNITSAVPPNLVDIVRAAYDFGLTRAFIFPVATGGVAFLSTFCIEWKNLKKVPRKGGDELNDSVTVQTN